MTDQGIAAYVAALGETDEGIAAYVAALGELGNVPLDSTADAGQYSYRYASLAAVLAHTRPVLARHGLAVTQNVRTYEDWLEVLTAVWHTTGLVATFGPLRFKALPNPQQVGSAASYARRYALLGVLNLAGEDDDAASVKSGPVEPPSAPKRKTPRQRAMARMMILFDERGLSDRDTRLEYTQQVLGRTITTANDLTETELRTVIADLEQIPLPLMDEDP